jgi:phenylpropionate dioxygenase-like ring-hydroxylating dioxygenase large terminal subunit
VKLAKMIEPDRVHRRVYADPAIFDQEMKRIFEKIWVYCGHESQTPKPGDFYTLQIGRQPMLMVRGKDQKINVLYNRCPHRGVQLCGAQKGNTGSALVCSYHAWSFHLDGKLRSTPLPQGYEGTSVNAENPDCSVKPAARVDSYRGFVFASLSTEGPSLLEFLGEAKIAFDDMCDRSPVGEVEVVPICHRVIQHSNWKFFMENQLDSLHPSVTHQSTGVSAARIEKRLKDKTGQAPLYYHYLSTFASSFDMWDSVQTMNFPRGHGILKAYMGLRPQDADTKAHEAQLVKAYGATKAEEYLSRSIHHVLVYPYLSVQSPLQQLRCLRPLAANKTLSEIWHFRLKGAPEAIYQRSLWYYNLVNSPATMINADDLENWSKGQLGLESDGGDWVSFHRNYGGDTEENGALMSNRGTSEVVMRSQFKAWSEYMVGRKALQKRASRLVDTRASQLVNNRAVAAKD